MTRFWLLLLSVFAGVSLVSACSADKFSGAKKAHLDTAKPGDGDGEVVEDSSNTGVKIKNSTSPTAKPTEVGESDEGMFVPKQVISQPGPIVPTANITSQPDPQASPTVEPTAQPTASPTPVVTATQTPPPLGNLPEGLWQGFSFVNADKPSVYEGKNLFLENQDPLKSCPNGYSNNYFQFIAWGPGAECCAETIAFCASQQTKPVGSKMIGTWCGYSYQNNGTHPSFYKNQMMCRNKLPKDGCPDKYSRMSFATISNTSDSVADVVWVCIQDAEEELTEVPQGTWCGYNFANAGIKPAAFGTPTKCMGHDPKASCPSSFQQIHWTQVAWHHDSIAETIFTCVKE